MVLEVLDLVGFQHDRVVEDLRLYYPLFHFYRRILLLVDDPRDWGRGLCGIQLVLVGALLKKLLDEMRDGLILLGLCLAALRFGLPALDHILRDFNNSF